MEDLSLGMFLMLFIVFALSVVGRKYPKATIYVHRLMVRKRWPLSISFLILLIISVLTLGIRIGTIDPCSPEAWGDVGASLWMAGSIVFIIFLLGATVPMDDEDNPAESPEALEKGKDLPSSLPDQPDERKRLPET